MTSQASHHRTEEPHIAADLIAPSQVVKHKEHEGRPSRRTPSHRTHRKWDADFADDNGFHHNIAIESGHKLPGECQTSWRGALERMETERQAGSLSLQYPSQSVLGMEESPHHRANFVEEIESLCRTPAIN